MLKILDIIGAIFGFGRSDADNGIPDRLVVVAPNEPSVSKIYSRGNDLNGAPTWVRDQAQIEYVNGSWQLTYGTDNKVWQGANTVAGIYTPVIGSDNSVAVQIPTLKPNWASKCNNLIGA